MGRRVAVMGWSLSVALLAGVSTVAWADEDAPAPAPVRTAAPMLGGGHLGGGGGVPVTLPATLPLPGSPPLGDIPIRPDGKGTIGLICVDLEGTQRVALPGDPSSENKAHFESCIRTVMESWGQSLADLRKDEVESIDFNLYLGGYSAFYRHSEQMRSSLLTAEGEKGR